MQINSFNIPNIKIPMMKASTCPIRLNKQLACDTVSFGAIKKSKLDSYQLMCANMFKAPLEKFKTTEDFTKWANDSLDKKLELDNYKCLIDEKDSEERLKRLNSWKSFLTEDKEMQSFPELALCIADSMTNNLYPDTRNYPPLCDVNIAKSTISEIDAILKKNPKAMVNFKKRYEENLKKDALESVEKIEDKTTSKNNFWVRIPSLKNDPENYEKNKRNLNVLSAECWCTKGYFADKYMKNGDFYIYMEGTSPELSVRLEDSTVSEVRDRNHDRNVPLVYYKPLANLMNEKSLDGFELELQDLEHKQNLVELYKSMMQEDIDAKNYPVILKSAGIEVQELEDGSLELSKFKPLSKDYTYQDVGIDENEMFKHISKIKGNADFGHPQVTNLGALKEIGGYTFMAYSKLNGLGKVETKDRVFRD